MDGVGQTQPRVLAGDLLLLEVDQRLVQPVLEVSGYLLGFVLLGAEHSVAPQLLLHLPAFVPEIVCLVSFSFGWTVNCLGSE